MATICAGRCFLSHIKSNPKELYSFGSPRVGNKRYVNFVRLTHYRFVNNNDIVTRVPPSWMGYRHNGTEIYLDHAGKIRKLGRVGKRRDRLTGFLKSLKRWRIDHFDDHSIHRYIAAIAAALAEESAGTQPPRGADGPPGDRAPGDRAPGEAGPAKARSDLAVDSPPPLSSIAEASAPQVRTGPPSGGWDSPPVPSETPTSNRPG